MVHLISSTQNLKVFILKKNYQIIDNHIKSNEKINIAVHNIYENNLLPIEDVYIVNFDNVYNNGYKNEPNTDWSLPQHQEWAQIITQTYRRHPTINIPTVIQGELCEGATQMGQGMDPSEPDRVLYHYAKMDMEQLNKALTTAEKQAVDWSQTTRNERAMILARVSHQIQDNRAGFI